MEIRIKRFLSLALAVLMVFSLMPRIALDAFATVGPMHPNEENTEGVLLNLICRTTEDHGTAALGFNSGYCTPGEVGYDENTGSYFCDVTVNAAEYLLAVAADWMPEHTMDALEKDTYVVTFFWNGTVWTPSGAQDVTFTCEVEEPVADVQLSIAEFSNGTVTADQESYKVGDTVTLTIAPAGGYFQKLYINGEPLMLGWKTFTYSFVAEKEIYNITGSFESGLNLAPSDWGRWDDHNQAHGVLNTYYPNHNDSWWMAFKGDYKSLTVKAKNYLPIADTKDNFMVVLRVTLDNGKVYSFRVMTDKGGYTAYNRAGIQNAGDASADWGNWKNLSSLDSLITTVGVDYKVERASGNVLKLSVNGEVLDTYTMAGVTADNKITEIAVKHQGNKGQYIEVPYVLTTPTYAPDVTLNIAEMTGGTVTPELEKYQVGDTVTLQVTPDAGYAQKLYINGEAMKLDWKTNTYSFKATEEVYNITGSFEPAINVAAKDSNRWDTANQAHGVLNAYYPVNDDSWWADFTGEYQSISVKAKNYLPLADTLDKFNTALRVTMDNGNVYTFRFFADKNGSYAYNRFGIKNSGDSVADWGGWKGLGQYNETAGTDGVDFKLERTAANTLTLTVGGEVVDTYTMKGITAENKVASVGVQHNGNKGQKIEIPYVLTKPHVHNVTAVEAKPATCYAEGNIAYWYCDGCGTVWIDEALTQETTLEAVKIPVLTTVAMIGDQLFASLQEAIDAAEAGATIDLLEDIEAEKVIMIGKSLTINGNGYTLTTSASRAIRITTSDAKVQINSLDVISTYVCTTGDVRGFSIDTGLAGIELTLNDCSVDFDEASHEAAAYAVNNGGSNGAKITVYGGMYEGANVINLADEVTGNTVTVEDAILTSTYELDLNWYGVGIYAKGEDNTVTVKNTVFNGANAKPVESSTEPTLENITNNMTLYTLPGMTPENPAYVTFEMNEKNTEGTATVSVPAGETYYFATTDNIGGMNMTANGEPVEVTYGTPNTWTITNDGTVEEYVLDISYPVGNEMNPAALNVGTTDAPGENTATVAAGSDGYSYIWTAKKAGTLTITMPAGNWTYVINNLTTGEYGDTQWSDGDPVVNPAIVEVAEDDEIQLTVNTYDPTDPWNAPAAELTFTAALEVPVALNKTTGAQYDSLAEALAAAKSGEMVKMYVDTTEELIFVRPGVYLDLNGCTLTASYVAVYNSAHIIDKSPTNAGLLVADKDHILISADNGQLPVWNGNGYMFTSVDVDSRASLQTISENSFSYTFQPLFERDVRQMLLNGAEDNRITIEVHVSWNTTEAHETRRLVYNEDQIKELVSNYPNGALSLNFSSAKAVGEIVIQTVVASEIGVAATSVGRTVTVNSGK